MPGVSENEQGSQCIWRKVNGGKLCWRGWWGQPLGYEHILVGASMSSKTSVGCPNEINA